MKKQKVLKPKNEKLFEITEIEGTPFMELKTENGCAAIFGKYQITEFHEDRKTLHETLKEKGWNLTTAVIKAVIETDREIKEKEQIINNSKNK